FDPDTSAASNNSTDTDTVSSGSDLSISKTASPTSLNAGEDVTYTIAITNNGPSTATSTQIADVLDSNLTGAQICTVNLPTQACNSYPTGYSTYSSPISVGTLTSAATATYKIHATVDQSTPAGLLSNT